MPPPSPPHVTITPTITVKDVTNKSYQYINPLDTKDLTKILDQSTQSERVCTSLILVSVDELQKSIVKSKDVKVKTQEPPLTTQTTKILFLPPPSTPKVVTDAL